MQSPLNAVGQVYHHFEITKYLPLEELQSTLIELVHVPTGARVMHIANDDSENLFCLSFQTLPASSNGVAHILEHTVLCGSKKFPVKDPFFAMTRRSLNTYMNALTGQDFTCYPASSQVEKDFYNLLDVYLDAAFYPELKKTSFLQEGHRLEFVDPKNLKGPLQYQGIVYNEMKGAMSSIESRLWKAICKHLFPDLPYRHNSGGDPQDIPSLTYEELVEFHKDFYHPSRCLFFFYGNLPLKKHLDVIAKVLDKEKKIPLLPPLPQQPRFTAPIVATESYPIAANESLEKKTQIAFAWLTAPISNQEEILALNLLEIILTDTDASPLPLALLKSGLCTQVESALDLEMSELPWTIVCKGCEEKDGEKLQKVLFQALEKFVSKPIPKDEIEAALHQLEFERKEIGADGGPFGLTLFMRAALLKQHGSEPENGLLIHTLFSDLRAHLKDPHYLPSLLKKYLIDNSHFVRLTLKPDPLLEKKEQEEEQKRLATIRAHLTEQEEKKIAEQTATLAHYQEEVEHQSLECLPTVTLKDVPPHAKDFKLKQKKIGKFDCFYHTCFTNEILYADLVFDLPELKAEQLPLLSLFSHMLTELGCGGRTYAETLAYQQAYIGELTASLALHVSQENPNVCRPSLTIKGRALYRNSDKLFQLFTDLVASLDLDDRERIEEWIEQHATELQNRLVKNAMSYATQTAFSGQSVASFIYNQWNGLPYYQAVLQWAKHCDESFFKALKEIAHLVLGTANPQLVLTCDESFFTKHSLDKFQLPTHTAAPWKGAYSLPHIESQARLIAAPVAFTVSGFKTITYKDPASPYLLLTTELFSNLILHKEIREKGGAYGSGATYTPHTGNFHFYSYRDPHLSRTIGVFQQALEKIERGEFNERELDEAKLGVIQTLDIPVPPGNRGAAAYAWKRIGRTFALREAYRAKILNATKEEIVEAVRQHLQPHKGIIVTLLGEDLWKKEQKKLKAPLLILPIESI